MNKPKSLGMNKTPKSKEMSKIKENKPKNEKISMIEKLRKEHNLTQSQVCESVGGMTEDTYRKYEKNPEVAPAGVLMDLAKFYNKSVDYLLGLSTYSHVENEEIEKLTGLSNKSIEVLRAINAGIHENIENQEYKDFESGLSINITNLINFVMEKSEVRYNVGGRTIFNLFSLLYDYIFNMYDTEFYTMSSITNQREVLKGLKNIENQYKDTTNEKIKNSLKQGISHLGKELEKNEHVNVRAIKYVNDDGSEGIIEVPKIYKYQIKTEIDNMLYDFQKETENDKSDFEKKIAELKKGKPFFNK